MPDDDRGEEAAIPPVVTFTSGAQLLVDLGIVESMTREGVRKIAKTHPDWPFGPGRAHAYIPIGNAQGMASGPFLEFWRSYRPKKRGPDRKPRRRRSGPAAPPGGEGPQ